MRDPHKVERQEARKQINRQLTEYQSIGYDYPDPHEKSLKEFEKEYERWATAEDLDKYLVPSKIKDRVDVTMQHLKTLFNQSR